MHPYFLDQHGEVVTTRQMGYLAAEQEEGCPTPGGDGTTGRRNHCSDDMNEAILQIESPSTATSYTTTAQVLSSALMDNPPTCYHLQPMSAYYDSVTGRFLQPQLSSATAVAAAPGPNCSSMLITDEPTGKIPSDIECLHAGGYSTGDGTLSYEGICVVERLDKLDLMNCLHGDDDYEFLWSILNAAEDSPAPGDILNRPTMLPPTSVPAIDKLIEEHELRIADEVAACIWLAEERFQERLLARATDMWAIIEAVPPVIHATGRGLSEEIADRLEATRQAVKVQLKIADDFARVRGRALIVEPDRGMGGNILRGDLITRLEMLRKGNVMGGYRLSVTECHQEVVERLRGIREAVIGRITENHKAAMTAVGAHGKQFSPVTSDDELLMGIDSVIQSSLQQLKETYTSFENAIQSTRARGRLHASQPSWGTTPEDTKECSKSDSSMSDTPSVKQGKRTRAGQSATDVKSAKKRKPGSGGRRCKNQDCSLHPHFGFTRPEYCSRHKLPGMFNVKGRRCNDPECSRTPVYGKRGDPHPTYCAAHKLVGMVDIKNPTCREPSCSRQPSFGSPQDRRATYCAMHMEEGMVNVRRMRATRASSRSSQAMGAAKAASTSTP